MSRTRASNACLGVARHEEGRVHDHAIADRLVRPRGNGHVAQRLEDLGDVALGACLQRRIDEPAVLHAREVGRTLLRRDLAFQAPDVFLVLFDLADDLVAIPEHLEAELYLAVHLAEDVGEGVVGRPQQFLDVVVGLEDRAERHRNHGVMLHHRLVHALVRQDVVARRVPNADWRVRDDRGDVLEVHGVHVRRFESPCRARQMDRLARLDDAVNVLALVAVDDHRRPGPSNGPAQWRHAHALEPAAGGCGSGRRELGARGSRRERSVRDRGGAPLFALRFVCCAASWPWR